MCVFVLYTFNLRVISFNCHGVKTSNDSIQELCRLSDIIFLQELWLYPDELTYLSNLSSDFCSYSLSSMTLDDKLIRSRHHGGICIMWRKPLAQGAKIVQFDDKRILGLKLNDCILLFLCIYLLYECDMFYDDFCFYLNKLQYIIETANTPYVFILGDYNADIQSESVLGSELINFRDTNSIGLGSVGYNFRGLGPVRYSFRGLGSGRGKGLGKRTQTNHFTRYPWLYSK